MLDDVGFSVSDYERSKAFYEKALAPIGLTLLLEPVPEIGGFGEDRKP
jgi:catechol 2,3-dioxygenase-like lactoylglutathione lyase family enzyme